MEIQTILGLVLLLLLIVYALFIGIVRTVTFVKKCNETPAVFLVNVSLLGCILVLSCLVAGWFVVVSCILLIIVEILSFFLFDRKK